MNTFLKILNIFWIGLFLYFLLYFFKLKKHCPCAFVWQTKSLIIIVIMFIVFFVANLINSIHDSYSMTSNVIPVIIFSLIQLLFIAFTFSFVLHVKKEKCNCAQTIEYQILFIMNIINIVSICLMTLFLCLIFITFWSLKNKIV